MMQYTDRDVVIIQGYTNITCYDVGFCYEIIGNYYCLIQI